ncbi:MAG: CoA transferase [Gammaproteobacteria bacterium]|nr:CoA transferase [Gammaproteobacteria bacterium]
MSNPLLEGVRVLDLTRLLPGPFCTLYLAQLGAEVTKIEDPNGGDSLRGMSAELFELVNRGKRSLTLDLRRAEHIDDFLERIMHADVVIESFRPGVLARAGLDAKRLRERNPRLVVASLTGYGQTGPYAAQAGHDLNYCAYAGVINECGTGAEQMPAIPNLQIADLAGGALTSALAIVAAVYGARQSGIGATLDAAMLDGTLALQTMSLALVRSGTPARRGGAMLNGGLPNYAVYRCADGRDLALGALEPKFFERFCKAVEHPEWLDLPPKQQAEAIRQLLLTRTRDGWIERLHAADCCVSPVLELEESLRDPQVRARGLVDDVGGKPAFHFPVRFDDAWPPSLAPAPRLGQPQP